MINIVTPQMLKKYRKFCYPILSLFAVVVTPPDFVSDLIVICILLFLYEISIMLSKFIYSKKRFSK
ncbi:twin-arginine translocase subunit TatC [Robertmurraya yapensis (ex Hitch et al 2024)]|uniref:twin-arginine translocase subunit TatC n=1 Tax=Robertmurraya yapensis (ex Hitch et al 2024) TaxID=3133160 RepID=UPI00336ADC8C